MQYAWNGNQIIDEIHQRISADMHSKAAQVVSIAEARAPKRTGFLATSIGYDFNEADLTLVFTVGAPYGIFVEYGTRNIRPHPYLRVALNQVFSRTYGFNTEMSFLNTPVYANPLKVRGGTFDIPKRVLTRKQREHVFKHLIPSATRHNVGAVARSRMHARREHY